MKVYVKTPPGLKFRLQGRWIDDKEFTGVIQDHAVSCFIRDGDLIVKNEVSVKKDNGTTKKSPESKNIKGRISDVKP